MVRSKKWNLWALDRDRIRGIGATWHAFGLEQILDAIPFLSDQIQIVPSCRGAGDRPQFSVRWALILCKCQVRAHKNKLRERKRERGHEKSLPDYDWSLHAQPAGSQDPETERERP
jgi:hypothetical protein